MTPIFQELCAILVDEVFGQLPSEIFFFLASRGRLTRLQLLRLSNFTLRSLNNGLAILVQHHLVLYRESEKDGPTYYEADLRNAYDLVRAAKHAELAESRFGDNAATIVSEFQCYGLFSAIDLNNRLDTKGFYTTTPPAWQPLHVNESKIGDIQSKTDREPREIYKDVEALEQLFTSKHVVKALEIDFMPPYDYHNMIESMVMEEDYPAGPKGKEKAAMSRSVLLRKRLWRDDNEASLSFVESYLRKESEHENLFQSKENATDIEGWHRARKQRKLNTSGGYSLINGQHNREDDSFNPESDGIRSQRAASEKSDVVKTPELKTSSKRASKRKHVQDVPALGETGSKQTSSKKSDDKDVVELETSSTRALSPRDQVPEATELAHAPRTRKKRQTVDRAATSKVTELETGSNKTSKRSRAQKVVELEDATRTANKRQNPDNSGPSNGTADTQSADGHNSQQRTRGQADSQRKQPKRGKANGTDQAAKNHFIGGLDGADDAHEGDETHIDDGMLEDDENMYTSNDFLDVEQSDSEHNGALKISSRTNKRRIPDESSDSQADEPDTTSKTNKRRTKDNTGDPTEALDEFERSDSDGSAHSEQSVCSPRAARNARKLLRRIRFVDRRKPGILYPEQPMFKKPNGLMGVRIKHIPRNWGFDDRIDESSDDTDDNEECKREIKSPEITRKATKRKADDANGVKIDARKEQVKIQKEKAGEEDHPATNGSENRVTQDDDANDGSTEELEPFYRLNNERFTVSMRSQRLVGLATQHLGEPTSKVYSALLRRLEQKIARCQDPYMENGLGPHDELDEEDLGSVDTENMRDNNHVSSLEVEAELDANLDLGWTIEPKKSSKEKINEVSGNQSSTNNSSSTKDKVNETTATQAEADTPFPNAKSNRISEIEQHLFLLAEHTHQFVYSVTVDGEQHWNVDFDDLISLLIQLELEDVVSTRYDIPTTRILRLLNENGKMEEKQLADLTLIPQKDFRAKLNTLYDAGYIDLFEVARDIYRQPGRALYLWYFDQERARKLVLDDAYKAMARLLQRLKFEKQKARHVIAKSERTDVVGHEDEYLSPHEQYALEVWSVKEEMIWTQVTRLDETVAILRDYLPSASL